MRIQFKNSLVGAATAVLSLGFASAAGAAGIGASVGGVGVGASVGGGGVLNLPFISRWRILSISFVYLIDLFWPFFGLFCVSLPYFFLSS